MDFLKEQLAMLNLQEKQEFIQSLQWEISTRAYRNYEGCHNFFEECEMGVALSEGVNESVLGKKNGLKDALQQANHERHIVFAEIMSMHKQIVQLEKALGVSVDVLTDSAGFLNSIDLQHVQDSVLSKAIDASNVATAAINVIANNQLP